LNHNRVYTHESTRRRKADQELENRAFAADHKRFGPTRRRGVETVGLPNLDQSFQQLVANETRQQTTPKRNAFFDALQRASEKGGRKQSETMRRGPAYGSRACARSNQRYSEQSSNPVTSTILDFRPFGENVKRLSLLSDESYVAQSTVQTNRIQDLSPDPIV
jgi:hypothetical protein